MEVTKAVITAAGPNQRKLPLQTLIDKNGIEKAFLEFLIEEVIAAGISDICIIINPGDEEQYRQVIDEYVHTITFIPQKQSLGYGHALFCAKDFIGNDPFLHLVGDHLYVYKGEGSSAKHLVEFAIKNSCAVSAVQPTREGLIPNFGVTGGKRVQGANDIYVVERVIEKPTPTQAEQELIVPGLRAGCYLCFFGMHVLTPSVMDILSKELSSNENVSLSSALNILAQNEQYLALEINEIRYDLGEKYGLFKAQLALALYGKERDRILTELLELFVSNNQMER